jgi:tRNA(Leu) C34 or U34 (ribose-2'-O)-methylase TrmL
MFSIGLHNPKTPINVGHVLRAADAYGAAMVAITGNRVRAVTNVSGAEYRIPVLRGDDLRALIPFGCVPVGVDLVAGAEDLRNFIHPPNAFYVFGAEDATLGDKVLSWCKYKVYVPTRICMNLSACVNVICYDRISKIRESNVKADRASEAGSVSSVLLDSEPLPEIY